MPLLFLFAIVVFPLIPVMAGVWWQSQCRCDQSRWVTWLFMPPSGLLLLLSSPILFLWTSGRGSSEILDKLIDRAHRYFIGCGSAVHVKRYSVSSCPMCHRPLCPRRNQVVIAATNQAIGRKPHA